MQQLAALSDQQHDQAAVFAAHLSSAPPVLEIEELLDRVDLAVEAASQAALPDFVPKAIARGRDMLIMSVGGLARPRRLVSPGRRKRLPDLCPFRSDCGTRRHQVRFDRPHRLGCSNEPKAGRGAKRHEVRCRAKDRSRYA